MSRTQRIDKQASNINYVGAWSGSAGGTEVQLETAYSPSVQYTAGNFGSSKILANSSGGSAVTLQNGVHFQYGKRLDASTSEDAIDGFGSTAGGIYDTANSGVFTGIRCLRVVMNNVNIKTYLASITKVFAMKSNISSSWTSPPSNAIYIDPLNSKFILPRPVYWSKMESEANLTTGAEIGLLSPTYSQALAGTGSVSYPAGKFNNGMYATNSAGNGTAQADINPGGAANLNWNKGAISFWGSVYQAHTLGKGLTSMVGFLTPDTFLTNFFGIIDMNWFDTRYLYINAYDAQVAISAGTTYHVYIAWDRSAGLSGSKTAKAWLNGSLVASTTSVWTDMSSYNGQFRVYAHGISGYWVQTYCDNLKIWNYVPGEDPSFEYNAGAGRESALSPSFAAADNYAPNSNQKTGYFYLSTSTNPMTSAGSGGDETETLKSSVTTNCTGLFGTGGVLCKNDMSIFSAYAYDKRLDASTTDDPTDGYGAIAGGAVDTGPSGALGANKYIRMVANALNVKNTNYPTAAYGGLKVYAKSLGGNDVNAWSKPPNDRLYVDPNGGKFILPGRPSYWSKCENVANMTTSAEIYDSTYPPSMPTAFYDYPAGKFGNGARQYTTIDDSLFHYTDLNIRTGNLGFSKGTVSYWEYSNGTTGAYIAGPGFGWDNYGVTTWYELYPWGLWEYTFGNSYIELLFGATIIQTVMISTTPSWNHIYAVWDSAKSLSGGKSFRVFRNGVEIISTTANIPSTVGYNPKIRLPGYRGGATYYWSNIDNIKYWHNEIISEDPSWEYNGGTGREDAMHNMYGAPNGYKPNLGAASSGTGYFRGGASTRVCTITV